MKEREEEGAQAQFVSGEITRDGKVVGYYEALGDGAAVAMVKSINFVEERNPATPPTEMDPVAAGYRTKTCAKCGDTKRISAFYKLAKAKDGHQSWCKTCQSEYDVQRRAKKRTPVRKSWLSKLVDWLWGH